MEQCYPCSHLCCLSIGSSSLRAGGSVVFCVSSQGAAVGPRLYHPLPRAQCVGCSLSAAQAMVGSFFLVIHYLGCYVVTQPTNGTVWLIFFSFNWFPVCSTHSWSRHQKVLCFSNKSRQVLNLLIGDLLRRSLRCSSAAFVVCEGNSVSIWGLGEWLCTFISVNWVPEKMRFKQWYALFV